MKTHTNDFKNEIKKFGRQIKNEVIYFFNFNIITEDNNLIISEDDKYLITEQYNPEDSQQINEEDIYLIQPIQEGQILKSLMKKLDLETKIELDIKTILNVKFGLLVNNDYEYLDFGNYVVYKKTYNADNETWIYNCYDMMLYSMIQYKRLNISYPITIRNYLKAISEKIGIGFENENDEFVNYNQEIKKDYFKNKNLTLRDILDYLSQITASSICISKNDNLEVKYPTNTEYVEIKEGTNIHIDYADDDSDFQYKLEGNTIQDGTPTPDSPVEIQTATGRQTITINETSYEINLGKNLFNKSTISENKRISSGGTAYTDNSYNLSAFIPVIPGATYTYSRDGDGGGNSAIAFYNINKTFISRTLPIMEITTTSKSFTIPENAYYVRIADLKTKLNSMQFEKGSIATAYSNFKSPIELCKLDNYQDKIYKNNNKWYLYKKIGTVILNGAEEGWTTDNQNKLCGLTISDIINNSGTSVTIDSLCNYYTKGSLISSRSNSNQFSIYNSKLWFNNQSMTLANFKTWVSNNNLVVVYPLQTPTTTEITDTELINQLNAIELFEGENNITITSSYLPSELEINLIQLDIINEEYLKNINVDFSEIFGPINKISLVDSENKIEYSIQDDISIEKNKSIEIRITDNPIILNNDQDEIGTNILNKLSGIYYSINDFDLTGVCYYDYFDIFKVKIKNNIYKCLLLSDDIEITQGLSETIYSDKIENSKTETDNYETNNWSNKEVQQKIVQLSDNKVENKTVLNSINNSDEQLVVKANKIFNKKTITSTTDADGFINTGLNKDYVILGATAQFSSNDYGFIIPCYYYNGGNPRWLLKIESKNGLALANTEITVAIYYIKIKEEYVWQI